MRPVSGRLSTTTSWRAGPAPAVSRCLSAAGVRFSVILFPPRDWAFLAVGLPNQRSGPRQGFHVPHARAATGVGASSIPGTTVLIPAGRPPQPAPAAPPRRVPAPRSNNPSTGLPITRHQRRFTQFTRPVCPSPVTHRMERQSPWAFPRASHPADQKPETHVGAGPGHRARTWNYALDVTSDDPPVQRCSLVTCDLVSHDRTRYEV